MFLALQGWTILSVLFVVRCYRNILNIYSQAITCDRKALVLRYTNTVQYGNMYTKLSMYQELINFLKTGRVSYQTNASSFPEYYSWYVCGEKISVNNFQHLTQYIHRRMSSCFILDFNRSNFKQQISGIIS